jgi:hypothetical protein
MVDRQRIQSICNRFSVCENSDERAFERGIELLYRVLGRAENLSKTLPAQLNETHQNHSKKEKLK